MSEFSEYTKEQLEEIVEAMTRRLIFAVNHYKYTGGMVKDSVTGKYRTPIYWFADALEMVGITFDPADLEALHMSVKDKRQYLKEKMKRKAEQPQPTGDMEKGGGE